MAGASPPGGAGADAIADSDANDSSDKMHLEHTKDNEVKDTLPQPSAEPFSDENLARAQPARSAVVAAPSVAASAEAHVHTRDLPEPPAAGLRTWRGARRLPPAPQAPLTEPSGESGQTEEDGEHALLEVLSRPAQQEVWTEARAMCRPDEAHRLRTELHPSGLIFTMQELDGAQLRTCDATAEQAWIMQTAHDAVNRVLMLRGVWETTHINPVSVMEEAWYCRRAQLEGTCTSGLRMSRGLWGVADSLHAYRIAQVFRNFSDEKYEILDDLLDENYLKSGGLADMLKRANLVHLQDGDWPAET